MLAWVYMGILGEGVRGFIFLFLFFFFLALPTFHLPYGKTYVQPSQGRERCHRRGTYGTTVL